MAASSSSALKPFARRWWITAAITSSVGTTIAHAICQPSGVMSDFPLRRESARRCEGCALALMRIKVRYGFVHRADLHRQVALVHVAEHGAAADQERVAARWAVVDPGGW